MIPSQPTLPRRLPILMYHAIDVQSTARFAAFAVPPMIFSEQVARLAEAGYQSLTVSGLIDGLEQPDTLPLKPVVLTFDDAFADFHKNAWLVLQRFGFTGTLFVPSAYIGARGCWLRDVGEGGRRILNWAQLREVAASGIEIGAHSHTHSQLDVLDEHRLEEEVRKPKKILEEGLARPIRTFAYPFGYHSQAVHQHVKAAGYAAACAVKYRICSSSDDRFTLPRVQVERHHRGAVLDQLLERSPATPAPFHRRWLTWAWRVVRRSQARVRSHPILAEAPR